MYTITIEWLSLQGSPYLQLDVSPGGYLVAFVYASVALALLIGHRRDFTRLNARRWLLFVLLLGTAPLAARAAVARLTLGAELPELSFALLSFLPMLAAALWLGAGPALLIGAATGLTWALFESGRITQPLELSLMGALIGLMLNQRYSGMAGHWLRQPLAAAPIGTLLAAWPLGLLGLFVTGQGTALANLERTINLAAPTLLSTLSAALAAGALLQAALARWPRWHPAHGSALQAAPWQKHLMRRILYTLVPLAALAILLLVGAVVGTSYQVAKQLIVDQMARDVTIVSNQVPLFVQTGHSLIRNLAMNERLPAADEEARQQLLAQGAESAFFQQILYLGADGTVLSTYPPDTTPGLSAEEVESVRVALRDGTPSEVVIGATDSSSAVMSFISAVNDPQTGSPVGVLIGRSALDANPFLAPAVDALHEGFMGTGEGFIIDNEHRILLYPAHPERQQQIFSISEARPLGRAAPAHAFRQRKPDGTHQIVYLFPTAGYAGWSVVVIVPDEVVLALALRIALPALLLLIAMAGLALPLAIVSVQRLTATLGQLLQAADRIAEGQLEHPVNVSGDDEIGRLGHTLEQMRVRLRSRLNELERLLSVSQHVSSNLELFRAMPPILSSALDATGAMGVRIVLRSSNGEDRQQAYAAGEAASAMALLDAQLLDLVEQQGTIVISQIWRAAGSLDTTNLLPRIRALVALPLRSEISFHGILWLSYNHEHVFEEAEMTFLSTLAGQAAVAITNARLFAKAEEGRRKLEAVLESTADGMIVVDNQGRVVLMNPSAERYLKLQHEAVLGRKVSEVVAIPQLAAQLADLREPTSTLEIAESDGKTLLATVSTIVGQNGTIGGRVAVLRDVTALKALDNLKNTFLDAVAHNLRSPLTFMKGYLTMLPLEGPVNERQREAIGKIEGGIKSIEQLSQRLIYLSSLTFSSKAEIELKLIDVSALIEEIYQQQLEQAKEKGVTLCLQIPDDTPPLVADRMLYSMAVMNLIENAVKYTQRGGQVTVSVYVEEGDKLTVAVADTGIGIRAEDQVRLFEPFYRVPQRNGEPERPRGHGLGLALVKAIAKAHKGTVRFESTFGSGSTFYLTLPLRGPEDLPS
mgnify:CR=1 FL=1